MFRAALTFAILLGLAGCASSPRQPPNPFAPYQLKASASASYTGRKLYKLGSVKVALDQYEANDKFPDAAGLEQIFTTMLTNKLENGGYLASDGEQALELDLDIKYKRTYSFLGGKGFGTSAFSYASDLKCGDSICASYASPELFANKGLVGNFIKMGKQWTMTGSPEDELSEIAIYANSIVDNLPR